MGRSSETFGKKEVRNKQAKKRKEKEARRLEKKEQKGGGKKLEDMIAYVDEFGVISSTPPEKRTKSENEDTARNEQVTDNNKMNKGRTGILKKLFASGGYGFILDLQSNKSVYVRLNNCIDRIEIGDTVEFDLEKGMKGMEAKNVKISKSQGDGMP